MFRLKLMLVFAVFWSGLSFSGMALPAQEGQKAAARQAKVSDTELRAFVKAYVEYQRIQQHYGPVLAKAKDSEKKRIQDEANAKIMKALAKQNLTVSDYNRIFKLVNGDEPLRKKSLKLIGEERKKS